MIGSKIDLVEIIAHLGLIEGRIESEHIAETLQVIIVGTQFATHPILLAVAIERDYLVRAIDKIFQNCFILHKHFGIIMLIQRLFAHNSVGKPIAQIRVITF